MMVETAANLGNALWVAIILVLIWPAQPAVHQNWLDEREMRQNPGLSSSARAASSSTNCAADGPSITSAT